MHHTASANAGRIRLPIGKSIYELVVRCPTKALRVARRRSQPAAESRAADAVDLHDAGVRPRLFQPQRGDAGDAKCAGIPCAGARLLHGRGPCAGSGLVGPRARSAFVLTRARECPARGRRRRWTGQYRCTSRYRQTTYLSERHRYLRSVRRAVAADLSAGDLPHASVVGARGCPGRVRAGRTGRSERKADARRRRALAALLARHHASRGSSHAQRGGDHRHGYDSSSGRFLGSAS
jgi:hypothetical protein